MPAEAHRHRQPSFLRRGTASDHACGRASIAQGLNNRAENSYLGTPDHRARVTKQGFTPAEIDVVVAKK